MSRTVAVDLGGVLLRWDPPTLLAEVWPDLAPDRTAALALVARLFHDAAAGGGEWAEFDRGVLGPDRLATRLSVRLGLPPGRVHDLLDAIPGHLTVQPETGRLLDLLQASGVRLVYLSNMPAPFADQLEALPQFRSWFDGGVFSSRVGCLKPEPRMYREAQRRLKLAPDRTLLLDDRSDNVAEAVRHGWSGTVFVDAGTAAERLACTGWL